MKRGIMILAVCMALAFLVTLLIQQSTQAQFPGGRGGGPGGMPGGGPGGGRQFNMKSMMMGNIQSSWGYVSFELEVDDETLVKARKIYQKAWTEQSKLADDIEKAGGGMGSIQGAREEAQKSLAEVHNKLKEMLSPEQVEKLNEWEKKTQEQSQQMRRGGGQRF